MIIFLFFVASFAAELSLKPPKLSLQTVIMQIGQGRQFDYPRPDIVHLTDIYSRSAINVDPSDTTIQRICEQIPPSVDFNHEGSILTSSERRHPEITTDFKDLLYRRQIIDSIIHSNQLYILFRNGSLTVIAFNYDVPLRFSRIMTVSNEQIYQGQLLRVGNRILIITNNETYALGQNYNSIEVVIGDKLSSKFSTAAAINTTHFAVAQLEEGISIFYFSDNELVLKGSYGKQFFKKESIYIVDLTTDGQNDLYVLDGKSGLFIADLSLGGQNLTLVSNKIQKAKCDNLLYTKGEVYIVCGDIFKYNSKGDQNITELPKPQFKVKQMMANDDVIIMVGDSLFKFYWHGRYVQLVEFTGASKILLTQTKYIAIKNIAIVIGNYTINSPTFYCQSDNSIPEQAMEVLFTTGAKCNLSYIKYLNDSQIPEQNDTCLYNVPVMINFWRADMLSIQPVIIGLIVLGIMTVAALFWATILVCKQKKLRGVLEYMEVSTNKTGYNVMVEEGENHTNTSGGSSEVRQVNNLPFDSKIQSRSQPFQDQSQNNVESHDIGD